MNKRSEFLKGDAEIYESRGEKGALFLLTRFELSRNTTDCNITYIIGYMNQSPELR